MEAIDSTSALGARTRFDRRVQFSTRMCRLRHIPTISADPSTPSGVLCYVQQRGLYGDDVYRLARIKQVLMTSARLYMIDTNERRTVDLDAIRVVLAR